MPCNKQSYHMTECLILFNARTVTLTEIFTVIHCSMLGERNTGTSDFFFIIN